MTHEPIPLFLSEDNFALATDLYELTMAAGYLRAGMTGEACFELFVRDLPPCRSYLIVAGLEQAAHYLERVRFSGRAIDYLRGLPVFANAAAEFFGYLREFRFRGDLAAMPEGTLAFPGEPLLQVRAPIIEAQIVETYLLSVVNFETLVATKASRVVAAARGRPVVDFGTRRAHGPQAGLLAARAAYIGGCVGTSNVLAGQQLGIPVFGTQAHSWIMAFEREEEAFQAYFETFRDHTTLLLDTYDTIAAARRAAAFGPALRGVRLDSGDLVALSRRVRRILDRAGLRETRILGSGDLNEYKIAELLRRGARIDSFGVGTDLVTSRDMPALPGVYKLVEQEVGGQATPRLKRSVEKESCPGRKQVWRFADAAGRYHHDLIGLADEASGGAPLLVPVLRGGKLAAPLPTLQAAGDRAAQGLALLPPRYRRLDDAPRYRVRWSRGLRALRAALIRQMG